MVGVNCTGMAKDVVPEIAHCPHQAESLQFRYPIIPFVLIPASEVTLLALPPLHRQALQAVFLSCPYLQG